MLLCCLTLSSYIGPVINYGEGKEGGGATNGRWGQVKFYPYKKKRGGGAAEKVLAMLKAGHSFRVV